MIAVQEANQMRPVQGLVFFGYNNLDPQTEPWNRVVQAFVLRDVVEDFERDHPEHPLVAVFKPLLVENEVALETEAVGYYRTIKYSELPTACKTSLLEVFVSWLEQRLSHKSKKEIEIMLLGELPRTGGNPIGERSDSRIGERAWDPRRRGAWDPRRRGAWDPRRRGAWDPRRRTAGRAARLRKAILVSLRARYGTVPDLAAGEDPYADGRRSGACHRVPASVSDARSIDPVAGPLAIVVGTLATTRFHHFAVRPGRPI